MNGKQPSERLIITTSIEGAKDPSERIIQGVFALIENEWKR